MVVPSEPRCTGRWHESAAAVLVLLIIGAVLTSPCWAAALIVWAWKS